MTITTATIKLFCVRCRVKVRPALLAAGESLVRHKMVSVAAPAPTPAPLLGDTRPSASCGLLRDQILVLLRDPALTTTTAAAVTVQCPGAALW